MYAAIKTCRRRGRDKEEKQQRNTLVQLARENPLVEI